MRSINFTGTGSRYELRYDCLPGGDASADGMLILDVVGEAIASIEVLYRDEVRHRAVI
jgi:hypothetical protein